MRRRIALAALSLASLAGGCSGSSAGTTAPRDAGTDAPTIVDFMANLSADTSCVLSCSPTCTEGSTPWICPALGPWGSLPHDPSCGAYDGVTTPTPVHGRCEASAPSGEAILPASRTTTPVVLPDGRRVAPIGAEWVFDETALPGGFPAHALLLPGGRWLVVSDDGYDTNALRVIDTTALLAGGPSSPVASVVPYESPAGLNYGLAFAKGAGVLYASGDLSSSEILAFDLDATTGALTADAARTIKLPAGALPQAIDLSADESTLLVSQALDDHALLYSLAAATYGTLTTSIALGDRDAFALHFDPNDATGQTAYTTFWTTGLTADTSTMPLVRLNVATSATTTIPVGKAPEELVFLSPGYAAVANALDDSLSIVDLSAGKVAGVVPIASQGGQAHGAGPSALAFDAPRGRLYVALSSLNGVAAFDVDVTGVPALTLAGVIPTGWWPTGLAVDHATGALYVVTGKGHGSGTDDVWRNFDTGEVAELIRGSVQAVPFQSDGALAAARATWDAQNVVAALPGQPVVDCGGAPYDFPVPASTTDGPSPDIRYTYFIVRENKTFDDLFGDLPGVDGDPQLVMSPGNMEAIWGNARALAQTFSHMDNYYSDAEQSIQGHAWTVFGRTTDYTERRWLDIWGRAEFPITDQPGLAENTTPAEGDLFSWLTDANVPFYDMGELVGGLQYRDFNWPGGTSDSTIPDTRGACYLAALARVYCEDPTYDKPFTYAWLANDHGFGYAPGYPNPAIMIAVNDEATGMLVDGLSHSPQWPHALVIVIEDDPNTGSDHVDLHRSIAVFASPWVKRGYVSHGHYDVASLHKLFANLLGQPYRNATIANAALPLDLFTSTPDYTPYTYIPRGYHDASCNKATQIGAARAAGWDFRRPDDQPGLDKQMWEALRSLPPGEPLSRPSSAP